MINNFYEYFLSVVINILDIGILYYSVHNITTPRDQWLNAKDPAKLPKPTLKVIVFGILHGTIIGYFSYFSYFFTAMILFRVVGIMVVWIIIMHITKDKLKNAIIIHAIILSMAGIINSVIVLPLQWTNMSSIYVSLISQAFIFISVMSLYKKISFNGLFVFIKSKLSGFNFLLLLAFAILVSIAYFIGLFHSSDSLIVALIIITSVISFYRFIIYIQKLNAQSYHVESVYEGIDYSLKTQHDVDVGGFPEREVQKKILASHPRIVVKHRNGTDAVYVDNIMYIELCNRKTKIMLENGQELLTSNTIAFWKKQLTSKNFGHPSQSYIVNFQHMDCIVPEEREITMDNGKNFTIPIRKMKETDDAFRNYLSSED